MLAKRNIKWESEEHLKFVNEVFERINFAAIKADNALAIERGAYKLFESSDWQNGDYFKKRGYTSEKWKDLQRSVCENGNNKLPTKNNIDPNVTTLNPPYLAIKTPITN